MIRVSSICSQMLQFFSRLEVEALVRQHSAERHARGFTCWQQFVGKRRSIVSVRASHLFKIEVRHRR